MWTSCCRAGQGLTSTTSTSTTTTPPEHLKWAHTQTDSQWFINIISPVVFCMFLLLIPDCVCVFVCVFKFPQINDINQNVKVTATGSGEATVTVSTIYFHILLYIYHLLITDVCFLNLRYNQIHFYTGQMSISLSHIKMHFCLCDRWCRCITLCLKKRRVTVRSLTCQCSSSQVIWCPPPLPVYLSSFVVILSVCFCQVPYEKRIN